MERYLRTLFVYAIVVRKCAAQMADRPSSMCPLTTTKTFKVICFWVCWGETGSPRRFAPSNDVQCFLLKLHVFFGISTLLLGWWGTRNDVYSKLLPQMVQSDASRRLLVLLVNLPTYRDRIESSA
jgi:hypothetical protein